jgi:hypothetical protein
MLQNKHLNTPESISDTNQIKNIYTEAIITCLENKYRLHASMPPHALVPSNK